MLSAEVCPVSTCANCIVFKTHLLGFDVFSKLPLWFISFFTPKLFQTLICLFIVEDMAQDKTTQIKGSWRFLNTTHEYTNKKTHFGHSFAFDAPTLWNNLPADVRSPPNLSCFRNKLKSYLFDNSFPPCKLPGLSVVSTWLCLWNDDY